MNIRQRTLILLGLGVAVLVGLLWAMMSSVTLRSFTRLEHAQTVTDVQRAQRALSESIEELHLKSADWATWDDTWHFVLDRNSAYLASNTTNQTFVNLHMNAIVITDTTGRVVFSKAVDLVKVQEVPVSSALMTALQASPKLSHIRRLDVASRGILVLPEGPAIVSARPILNSNGKGPVHGTFVFVRDLSKRDVRGLSNRTLLHVSVHPIGYEAPPDVRDALVSLKEPDASVVRPLDSERVAGYSVLRDLSGRPALVLKVEAPRRLYRQGLASLQALLWSVPIIGLLFGALMMWVLERQVLRRLGVLSAQVARAGRAKDEASEVALAGSDELAELGRTFNESLRARRAIEQELVAARDQAEAASRAKSGFLAAMSHEIRTPMNGVLGMTSLLLDTELSATQREFCLTIQNSGDALLTILNDILDFSKIEAGKMTVEPLTFDLSTAIDEVCDLMLPRASEKDVELIVHYSEGAPRCVVGDAGRIRQVLMNLIGNAIKFTERGYVLIEVESEPAEAGHATFVMRVRDTGIGIRPEAVPHLFQVFVQADASTTRRFGGTGLGLAISKRIVEAMEGEMGVDTQWGEGSSFWFRLRLPLAPERARTEDPQLSGRHVLIVDDVAVLRSLLARRLERWGVETAVAANGHEALALLTSQAKAGRPFDAALVDLRMPEMDGEELCRAARRQVELAALQLIIMTGHPHRGDGSRFETAGIDGYLVKPMREALLRRALSAALNVPREKRLGIITRHSLDEGGTMTTGAAVQQVEFHGLRVLLAEDNATNQKIAVRMMEQMRCRVSVAGNGVEAVEMIRDFSFDVILMDVQMPEMDGFQAARRIRELEGTGSHTPIIALTANVMESDRQACLEAGMDDFLGKPLKREDLLRMLERWGRDAAEKAA